MGRFELMVVLVAVVGAVGGFNFEVRDPVVKRGEPGSYFGYSVAEHITSDNVKWLLVGAPLGRNLQPKTNRSGALFKCSLEKDRECEQVKTDGLRTKVFDYDETEDEQTDLPLNPPGNDEIKEGQWLGVSVKSQGKGGKVMVCAHRYIVGKNLNVEQHGLGLCYSLDSNLDLDENWEPCQGRPMVSGHQQYGFCQVGTSLALLEDGTALIGSPGPYTWRGTMFVVSVVGAFLERDKNVYLGPLDDNSKPIDKYSYLGMSVTAGKFFEKNVTHYVSGAPRANHQGAVYFFNKKSNILIMDILLIVHGDQFAANFGYELLATDANNDGYDDLLVAAPFFYNETQGGAVYVYYNLRNCTKFNSKCEPDLVLTGNLESRFGFSMTALGDINHDGYTDVAIGAPYEHPNGAIYIYLGGKNGLNPEYSQKIQVKGPKTIGHSLSGGMDMDDNDYPDLLTGAYESDTVILFKTRPIIHVDIEIRGDERFNIDPAKSCPYDSSLKNRTCFAFETCFKLKRPNKYAGDIKVKSYIEADIDKANGKFARVRFSGLSESPHLEKYITWNGGRGFQCQREIVYIKESNRDILSPIKFRVNYTLPDADPMSPILNQTSVKEFHATFQKDCGKDDLCESELILNASLPLTSVAEDVYSLNLGSDDELTFNVNIWNKGESAYEAQLFVIHPPSLSYIALINKMSNINCIYTNDTLVTCSLGNPFPKKKSVSIGLRFESKIHKMDKLKELEFKAFVNSTSKELSKRTSVSLKVEVKKKAEVKIGSASTSYVIFGGAVKGESAIQFFDEIGTKVWHTYQIINEGPWSVDDLEVVINWPLQVESGKAQGKWLLYLEGVPKVEYDDGVVSSSHCIVNTPFFANELNITDRHGSSSDTPPENLRMLPRKLDVDPPTFVNLNRRRRQAEYTPPEKLTSSDGKRNIFTLDCETKTAKCAKITCTLPKLQKGSEATIQIKSRIWNSTLVEDYSKMDSIKIVSKANIFVPNDVEQDVTDDDEAKAETTAFPETTAQDSSISIWVIVVAVVVGILLFLILVLVFYKCGFFNRNRVNDPTLSGNLMKVSESESLLNK